MIEITNNDILTRINDIITFEVNYSVLLISDNFDLSQFDDLNPTTSNKNELYFKDRNVFIKRIVNTDNLAVMICGYNFNIFLMEKYDPSVEKILFYLKRSY